MRRALGPFERTAAELYRSFFYDIEEFADRLAQRLDARSILEVGCGEGRLAEALCRVFPRASYLGIDISDRVGRLFGGERGRVEFRQLTAAELAQDRPQAFDLVVIGDVLHHVPVPERVPLLRDIGRTVARKGRLVVKEWIRRPTPIHLLAYLSDRVVTGDRIRYCDRDELRALLDRAYGEGCRQTEELVLRPWRNNVAIVIDPAAAAGEEQAD